MAKPVVCGLEPVGIRSFIATAGNLALVENISHRDSKRWNH